jgi:hypothetical protein
MYFEIGLVGALYSSFVYHYFPSALAVGDDFFCIQASLPECTLPNKPDPHSNPQKMAVLQLLARLKQLRTTQPALTPAWKTP